eukprot:TRINITY_DN2020_c0_g1_i1.p1 TRINITY_DN2020_c0_g1~~TRINITY_DN2020_c0_g1_i1.p1  ORF type:complete len:605 (+),score=92.04 TRINITY_DN2020_c0_g1_i1:32-1846(+)
MKLRGLTLLLFCFGLTLCQEFTLLKIVELEKEQKYVDLKRETLELEEAEITKRSCPNNCNGNGYCVSSTCQCNQGYTGVDCSIYTNPLVSGRTVTGSVSTFEFKYYSLTLQDFGDITVQMNQTTYGGDVDLYIQIGYLPTRSSYLIRDVSTSPSVSFTMSQAAAGTYYFGIYGFTASGYTLTVTNLGQCPKGCSGNGECTGIDCECYDGWTGLACDVPVTILTNGVSVSGSVVTGHFDYYSYYFSSGNTFTVTLTETSTSSSNGDVDLYVRYAIPPTLYNYADANVSTNDVSSLHIVNAQVGMWFIGIYAFRGTSYSLVVTSGDGCPNQCSQRGTCGSADYCICNSGYSGDYCQTKIAPMGNWVPESGFVNVGSWNYFKYLSNSVDNLDVTLYESFSQGRTDCDLYVRQGAAPTRVLFDYVNTGIYANSSITIPDPGQATWWIGVYGFTSCSYTLVAQEDSTCPNGCSGHGQCTPSGVCLCNDGWAGVDCSQGSSNLGNNPVSGAVSAGNWSYYSVDVQNASTLYVTVKETSTTGYLWVYVGKTTPTLRTYSQASTDTNTNIHRLTVIFDGNADNTYQIGIYGNPFSPSFQSVNYSIQVFAAKL